MLTDQQLIQGLRVSLERATAELDPPPDLLSVVHRELESAAERRQGRIAGRAFVVLAGMAAVAVVAVALFLVGREHPVTGAPPVASIPPGTARVVARAPDPRGGLAWALRMVQPTSVATCLQVGRVASGVFGATGQDGRFHSVSPTAAGPGLCTGDDANGHAYMNVFSEAVPASAGKGIRNLAYGLLGPDAVSVAYPGPDGRTVTERTGLDGAYLVVVPGTTQTCALRSRGGGRSCIGGSGEITTGALRSGVITAVTYRDGHVCRLPAPTPAGTPAASCPGVGYTAVPFHPPHITASEVATPVIARVLRAKQYCYQPATELTIPCDHGVPRGYKRGVSGVNPPELLIQVTFTARLAATNGHSVYEWSLSETPDDPNCSGAGGGLSATTMTPIRAGQRVVLQSFGSACAARYTGLVTYQPNGWPGHDTLSAGAPIRDGSVLVGRFSFVVR